MFLQKEGEVRGNHQIQVDVRAGLTWLDLSVPSLLGWSRPDFRAARGPVCLPRGTPVLDGGSSFLRKLVPSASCS